MLTQKDFHQIEAIVEEKLDQKLDEKLKERLRFLPTKEEFYEKMDEIMGELKAIREEMTILTYRSSDHEDRLEKLENIHPHSSHN